MVPKGGSPRRVIGVVIEDNELGRFHIARREGVNSEFAKPPPERFLLVRGNFLVAENQHLMLGMRFGKRCDHRIVERLR